MPMKLALLWILTPEAMNARLAERQKERMQEEPKKKRKAGCRQSSTAHDLS